MVLLWPLALDSEAYKVFVDHAKETHRTLPDYRLSLVERAPGYYSSGTSLQYRASQNPSPPHSLILGRSPTRLPVHMRLRRIIGGTTKGFFPGERRT